MSGADFLNPAAVQWLPVPLFLLIASAGSLASSVREKKSFGCESGCGAVGCLCIAAAGERPQPGSALRSWAGHPLQCLAVGPNGARVRRAACLSWRGVDWWKNH